jgi:hypothetical protein
MHRPPDVPSLLLELPESGLLRALALVHKSCGQLDGDATDGRTELLDKQRVYLFARQSARPAYAP